MRIAAYCRVSTDKTDQLNSLQTQKEFFAQYAQKEGHELVRLYADEGISGTKTRRRKAFLQMMADAETGLFQKIVVKDISRLARNTVDLLQSVRHLKVLGIETVFLTAAMTSMGESEFVLTVFGALAQEESRNTSKRVKFGKQIHARQGRVPNLVYGYDKTPGDYFHLSINEEEAAVVGNIFTWYVAEGWGGSAIARALNQQGLKTKRGCSWSQSAVCRILSNPIYTGKVVNGRQEVSDFLSGTRTVRDASQWFVVDRPELRIVAESLFQQAQDLMSRRRQAHCGGHSRQSSQYLLSALIHCSVCGRSFRRICRTYRNTCVRWMCSRHNAEGAAACPNAASIEEGPLIDALNGYFSALFQDPVKTERLIRKKLRAACAADISEENAAQARLNRLEKRRQRLLLLYADEGICRKELDACLSAADREIQQIREARERSLSSGAALEQRLADVMGRLRDFLRIERMGGARLKRIVDRIEVDRSGKVDVYLQPLNAAAPPSVREKD